MLSTRAVHAGVWGIDPSVGIAADYATNPVLLDLPHTSETDLALLLNAPTTYTGDGLALSIQPTVRVADTRSYDSVNSDYGHLNLVGEYDRELDTIVASAGYALDSSLYQNYLLDGNAAVRREALNGELTWTRHLTERLSTDLDLSTSHVQYGHAVGGTSLTDYKYSSVSPDITWLWSERDRVTLSAFGSLYDSLDGTTSSRNYSGQIGYTRALSELWSLNVSAGYNRSQNRLDLELAELAIVGGNLVLIYVPFTLESTLDSAVYSAKLTRTGERLTLNLTASRQEVPTGFAYLSRATQADIQLSYSLTARWSAALHEYYVIAQDPSLQGNLTERRINSIVVDATYRLNEHWNLDLALSRTDERYLSSNVGLSSSQVTLTLTDKLNHISLQ